MEYTFSNLNRYKNNKYFSLSFKIVEDSVKKRSLTELNYLLGNFFREEIQDRTSFIYFVEASKKINYEEYDQGGAIMMRLHKTKLHLWRWIDNPDFEDEEKNEGIWIDNDELFKIANTYYTLKESYKKSEGYTAVTDEVFDTEKQIRVDYRGEVMR